MDENWRDLALLNLAVDTCLRGIDLVQIKRINLTNHTGDIKSEFEIKTSKTGAVVKCTLQPTATFHEIN